jgi:hypothetical protein
MSTDKKLEKLEKILGKDKVLELQPMAREQLETQVVNASASIKQAQDELEANARYQEIKESLKDLSAGLKEVKKRQNAIIQYSLFLLEQEDVT